MDARRTPSPAYANTDAGNSTQAHSDLAEGSSALSISNDHSAADSSADATTIRSPIRSSLERSAEIPLAEGKTKERTSTESQGSEHDKKGKRVQRMLKNQVHKQQARINTISKKIGHGVSRSSLSLHRSNSAPGMSSRRIKC